MCMHISVNFCVFVYKANHMLFYYRDILMLLPGQKKSCTCPKTEPELATNTAARRTGKQLRPVVDRRRIWCVGDRGEEREGGEGEQEKYSWTQRVAIAPPRFLPPRSSTCCQPPLDCCFQS